MVLEMRQTLFSARLRRLWVWSAAEQGGGIQLSDLLGQGR